MIIYKITNKVNNKIYIGQTINSLEQRFSRHKQDALSGRLDTHLARAIRKYGEDNFIAEIIDTAQTQDELTKKEYYWIGYYDACNFGYNETNDLFKCGGNTYKYKTKEELNSICLKIRESKLGGKNPASKRVKCKNIVTNEEKFFDSLSECQEYFSESNHNFITRRCLGKTKCLYKKQWAIAYADEQYADFTVNKNSAKAQPVEVFDTATQQKKRFPSYSSAEEFFGTAPHAFCNKAYKQDDVFQVDQYIITKIK